MDTASHTASPTSSEATSTTGAHEAVVADSAAEHAHLVAPRVAAAVAAGHAVALAVDAELRASFTAALGETAAGVRWFGHDDPHQVPAFTIAQQLSRFARHAATAGTRALAVGQHATGLPGCADPHWPRLEIAFNVVAGDLPVDIVCLYRSDSPDLRLAATTHPWLRDADGARPSGSYVAPERAVAAHPVAAPAELGPPTAVVPFGEGRLGSVRRRVLEFAEDAGLDADRVDDLVLAVSELVSNSVEHGAGSGLLRLWQRPHDVVAEVVDHGGGMRGAFPGLRLPPADGERGRGLWLAAELCDVLQVWAEPDRTTVRVEMTGVGRAS